MREVPLKSLDPELYDHRLWVEVSFKGGNVSCKSSGVAWKEVRGLQGYLAHKKRPTGVPRS